MAVQTAATQTPDLPSRHAATRLHWPEYLIEATCLGLFMVSICIFGALFEHPNSPVRQWIEDSAVAAGTWTDFWVRAIACSSTELPDRAGTEASSGVETTA